MFQISHEVAVTLLIVFAGFVGWLINVTFKLASIKSTLESEMRFLRVYVEVNRRSVVDHDRRIQRIEDGSHGALPSKA